MGTSVAPARGSPIFTQPLSVMSRLDTFRSLPRNREWLVSIVLQAMALPQGLQAAPEPQS